MIIQLYKYIFTRIFSQTSNSPLSVLESSVISEIATPISSCASSALNQKNLANNYNSNNDDGSSSSNNNINSSGGNESKLSSALSGSRSNGLGGSKTNIVIELKEDLKPRRPLRPRPRSEVIEGN